MVIEKLKEKLFRGEKNDDNRTVNLTSDDIKAANAVKDQILSQKDVQIPYEISLEYNWDSTHYEYTLRTGQMGEMKSQGIVEPNKQKNWNAIENKTN